MLALVVLLADVTLPDAASLGIYSAEDGDDVSLDGPFPDEYSSIAGAGRRAAALGDSWSARVALTLMTVRDRAPPAEGSDRRITIPAPPSVPLDSMCPPAWVATDPVVASFTKLLHQFGDGLEMTQEGSSLVTGRAEPVPQSWRKIASLLRPLMVAQSAAKSCSPNHRGGVYE